MQIKTKLHSHQLHAIKEFIGRTYDILEDDLLEKYGVSDLTDLNASDYDAIMEDLCEWLDELNSKYKE